MRRTPAKNLDALADIGDWDYAYPPPPDPDPPKRLSYAHSLTRTPADRPDCYLRLALAIDRVHGTAKQRRYIEQLRLSNHGTTHVEVAPPQRDPQQQAHIEWKLTMIAQLLDQGVPNDEIALRLGIKPFMVMHFAAGRKKASEAD